MAGLSDATAALERLYAVVRLNANVFQTSFKLQEKTLVGARVIKRYHPPIPPAVRVLAHPDLAETDKERLRAIMSAADPVLLFAGIRAAQEELGKLRLFAHYRQIALVAYQEEVGDIYTTTAKIQFPPQVKQATGRDGLIVPYGAILRWLACDEVKKHPENARQLREIAKTFYPRRDYPHLWRN